MRLTLRTLLAYLDGMLEPADAAALKAKIEESDFAKVLTARIETTIRLPRLASLPPEEKGLGLDANSIAEYLDNTLSADLVPQLEQFLLQSDMQLAEVAACHQVLASVLDSEPMVPAELRHRIRCLGSPKEITHPASSTPPKKSDLFTGLETASTWTGSAAPLTPTDSALHKSSEAKWGPAAPNTFASNTFAPNTMSDSLIMTDPLRPTQTAWSGEDELNRSPTKSKRGLRIAITLALVGLLVLATLQAVGPLNRLQNLWTAGTNPNGNASAPASTETRDWIVAQAPDSASPPADTSSNPATTSPTSSDAIPPPSATETPNAEASANSDIKEARETPAAANAPQKMADTAAEPPPASSTSSSTDKPNLPLLNVQVASWSPPTELPQNHLLFAMDEINHRLYRITSATSFAHNTRLLIGPAVRSSIQVHQDVRWDFYSAADTRVTTDSQMPWLTTLDLEQGKAILQDSGKSNFIERQPQTLIRHGDMLILVRWLEPNSALAVEAAPTWSDPSQYDPQYVGPLIPVTDFRLAVLQGKVEFAAVQATQSTDVMNLVGGDQGWTKLELGDTVARRGDNAWEAGKIAAPPNWIANPIERPIDRQAAGDLMQLLPAGARANLVAVEALANRRAEVAALAAQTLILADDFSFLAGPTGMLNDERFRSHWSVLIDAVRERIATSKDSFEALKASLAAQDVQRGALLFQVLVGYSGPELKLNAAERLVNLLESEYLDERILAIYHLKRIVGKDLGFQPDRPSRGVVQDWKRLLRGGGISPKEVK